MNVDHFFTIGTVHQALSRPCEDYALSDALPNGMLFGVVTDGCGGANAHTDVGARALAWAFKQALVSENAAAGEQFGAGFHASLLKTFRQYQYPGTSGDYMATLVGFAGTDDDVAVYVQGDGALAISYADGTLRLVEFVWRANKPFYLNYYLYPNALTQFEDECAAATVPPFRRVTTVKAPGSEAVPAPTVESFTFQEAQDTRVMRFKPREEGIVSMAVVTDGIAQWGSQASIAAAEECLAFKNSQGDFVKRRMRRALKTTQGAGHLPQDDIGIAAAWFGHAAPAPAAQPENKEQS